MTIKQYKRRKGDITALHMVIGAVSKNEILDFCPDANVGVPIVREGLYDDSDIRWISIPTRVGEFNVFRPDDYLVKFEDGRYEVYDAPTFAELFEEVEE